MKQYFIKKKQKPMKKLKPMSFSKPFDIITAESRNLNRIFIRDIV